MILTDTHTHLYSEAFDEDRKLVVERAMEKGIQRFFLPAIDHTYTGAMLELVDRYPDNIFPMMGLHPTHVKEDFREGLAHVDEMLEKRKFYAIGEIGIDLYWDKTFLDQQIQAFEYQIALAKKHGLPIVIHSRDSFDEIFEVLENADPEGLFGIFHCFTGTFEQAQRAIALNMKLGIGGVLTYKNGKIDTFLNRIPLEHIVLETDSPYLSPVPYRGKRNESSYLIEIASRLAEVYGLTMEEVAEVTTQNSKKVFGV